MAYKNTFTEYELLVLNNGSYRQNVKESLMSVYAYIIKHSKETSFTISFAELLKMYNRYHNKLKLATLKKRISKLKDLGLISVAKINHLGYKLNSYVANRTTNVTDEVTTNVTDEVTTNVTDEVTTNVTDEVICLDIENTNVEVCEEKPKYITSNFKRNIDLDCNNNNVKKETEKVKDIQVVIKAAKKCFKKLNVRSKFIRTRVLAKLNKYGLNVSVTGLDKYIEKVIEESREISIANYDIRQANVNKIKNEKNAKQLKFNNFDQRQYDYNALEKGLLGWEEDKTIADYEIKKDKQQDNYIQNSNLKFNNFDQRQYSDNEMVDLEKQLLGWQD